MPEWRGFVGDDWRMRLDVREFIRCNVTPYTGDDAFLTPATERTTRLWDELRPSFVLERALGVLDVSQIPSSITAHAPGYIDRDLELVVSYIKLTPEQQREVVARTFHGHS